MLHFSREELEYSPAYGKVTALGEWMTEL